MIDTRIRLVNFLSARKEPPLFVQLLLAQCTQIGVHGRPSREGRFVEKQTEKINGVLFRKASLVRLHLPGTWPDHSCARLLKESSPAKLHVLLTGPEGTVFSIIFLPFFSILRRGGTTKISTIPPTIPFTWPGIIRTVN